MIETSQSIKALTTALLTVQGTVQGVVKDAANPFFKKNYASLESVIDTIRKPMTDAGLIFTQAPGAIVAGAVEITTMIAHNSGEWMRSTLHVPLAKTDPQGVGSAITYGCRYALMATLGLPPLDDDAEAAVSRAPKAAAKAAPPKDNASLDSITAATDMIAEMRKCKTLAALEEWGLNIKPQIEKLKDADAVRVRTEYGSLHNALKQAENLAA